MTWFRLRWPREVEPAQLIGLCRVLHGVAGLPVMLEAVGSAGRVTHRLAVPWSKRKLAADQLRAALPGLYLVEIDDRPVELFGLELDLRLSTARRSLAVADLLIVSRPLVTALAAANSGETVVMRWQLVAHAGPGVVPNKARPGHESWMRAVLSAPLGAPPDLDTEGRNALKTKRSEPGWRAIGRIGVRAATPARAGSLAEHLLGAIRTAEAPGVRIEARRLSSGPLGKLSRRPGSSLLNVLELPAVTAWPSGEATALPVSVSRSRALPASKTIPTAGRVIGESTAPGRTRSVALNPPDALRHLHVLGPTGVGKSTLLLNLISADLTAGAGVVVVEPKGDLIADVLARIPAGRLADVVLLDPTDPEAVVGLNPLRADKRSPELAADQLLAVFKSLYASSWGPRTQDIIHAALLTLTRRPGSTLVELPLLLTDAGFRRRIVGDVDEPVVLEPFWAGFEAWTEAQRTEAIAPVLNKVRPFLLRSNLRAVLGQAKPRFDIREVFTKRKVLLVNLAKGAMGSEAAALLGSLVVAQLWQATLERSEVEPARRRPVFVYVDEFADYLNLPTDLAEALAEARGLGVSITLAHQHLHQLKPEMRSAVLANARSRVCFQLAPEDARMIANGSPGIDAEDLQHLPAFEVYAQLVADSAVQPWLSARTRPAPNPTSSADEVRRRSRDQYAVNRAEVDAAISSLRAPDQGPGDIGARRSNRGAA